MPVNDKAISKSRRPTSGSSRRTSKARVHSSVPRGLTPAVHKFKRDIEEVLSLSGDVAPEGWTLDGTSRLYRQLGWSLGSLPNNGDFTDLFAQYRLKGARMRLYFSQDSTGVNQGYSNSQLMVRMAPNNSGQVSTLNQAFWQQAQAKEYKLAYNGGEPLDFYMPLKIANEVTSSTGTANSMMSPNWINVVASNVQHYGMNLSIERVDGQAFTTGVNNYQRVRVITTLYLETRRVQ